MTTTDPLTGFGTNLSTPQSQQAPGRTEQVQNNAGGFVFQLDPLAQLRRFLTIGTAGGTYYVGQDELTKENGELVLALTTKGDTHRALVDTIVEISLAGRALKQNPTLFALAIACQHGPTESKQYARQQITKVARTGTMLFQFVGYLEQFGGWSRGLRKAVGAWYTEKEADDLAYQLIKYRQREGWTHRDVLRLAHPKIEEPSKRALVNWLLVREGKGFVQAEGILPRLVYGFEGVNTFDADVAETLKVHNLPWEALPDSAMNDVKVWEQLINNGMPLHALLRQLPRLTKLGLVDHMGGGMTDEIIGQLLNEEKLQRSRMHPFAVLTALKTYSGGQSFRGDGYWTPAARMVDALDEMFYRSFQNVVPTGKRTMDALDVSGSMGAQAAGNLPMTCREVTAALAMVNVRTEVNQMTVGFTGEPNRRYSGYGYSQSSVPLSDDGLTVLPVSKRQRLDDVIKTISGLPFGSTDCALPMDVAREKSWEIDTFVIYTDNETWCGRKHPYQALRDYRKASGIDARLVVVSITPTSFSIADPKDPGMLDISGFDSAAPSLIADFSRGDV